MTEEQKVQELLKPRYRVIADYPGSEFTINQIIVPQLQNERHEFGSGLILMLFAFPHLFRKLEWWEERRPEELPQFVKDLSEKKVLKARYKFSEGVLVYVETMMEGTGWYVNALPDIEPATSADYHAYISSPELK